MPRKETASPDTESGHPSIVYNCVPLTCPGMSAQVKGSRMSVAECSVTIFKHIGWYRSGGTAINFLSHLKGSTCVFEYGTKGDIMNKNYLEKQQFSHLLRDISLDELMNNLTIDQVFDQLNKLKTEYSDYKLSFVIDPPYDEYSGESCMLYGTRWETDQEYQDRIALIKASEQAKKVKARERAKERKEREKQEYLRLKAKFEK